MLLSRMCGGNWFQRNGPACAKDLDSAYLKQRIYTYKRREFRAYVKRFHGLEVTFGSCACIFHLTRHSSLSQLARKFGVARKQRMMIVSAEFSGKQSQEIGPYPIVTSRTKCHSALTMNTTMAPIQTSIRLSQPSFEKKKKTTGGNSCQPSFLPLSPRMTQIRSTPSPTPQMRSLWWPWWGSISPDFLEENSWLVSPTLAGTLIAFPTCRQRDYCNVCVGR